VLDAFAAAFLGSATLRGLGPELFAPASLTNGLVLAVFIAMYILMTTGFVRFDYRGR
jgi:hypothetical protein